MIMVKRGTLYRCHLFSYAGPQTEGVDSFWMQDFHPIGEREVKAGELVEMVSKVDGTKYELSAQSKVRLDILEQDFLLTGGLDDFVVSYLSAGATPENADTPKRDKLLYFMETTANKTFEATARAFRREHMTDFMDYILILKDPTGAGGYYVVAWWEVLWAEDYANAEMYFIINVDETFDDQSEGILDVSEKRVLTPQYGPNSFFFPSTDDVSSTAKVGNQLRQARSMSVQPEETDLTKQSETVTQVRIEEKDNKLRLRSPLTAYLKPPSDQSPSAGQPSETKDPNQYRWVHPQGSVAKDYVERQSSEFNGKLVIITGKWNSITISTARYAVSYDLRRAILWGQILFGSRTFIILEGPLFEKEVSPAYYVLRSNTIATPELGRESLIGQVRGRDLYGINTRYSQIDFYDVRKRLYVCRVVITSNDKPLLRPPWEGITDEFYKELDRRNVEDPDGATIPKELAKTVAFEEIEAAVKRNDDREAARLLSDLDANAFRLLSLNEREQYIKLLTRAWTFEREEIAIIELFKSCADADEIRLLMKHLETAGIKDQVFNDLDGNIWSLLVTVGESFGQNIPLDWHLVFKLLIDSKVTQTGISGVLMSGIVPGAPLLSITSGFEVGADGRLNISHNALVELQTAAQAFVQFIVSNVEGIWMLVSEPDKIIEGVGQLIKLMVMAKLAELPLEVKVVRDARDYMNALWAAIGKKIKNAMLGIEILSVGEQVARRVKWALLWEAISMVVGVGEVKAAIESLEVLERLRGIAWLARILRLGESGVAKVERIAVLLARSGLGKEEELLRLMTHLPKEDLLRLETAVEKIHLENILKLEQLPQDAALLESVRHVEGRLKILMRIEEKAGAKLSADAGEGFRKLAARPGMTNQQALEIVESVTQGNAEGFFKAIKAIPDDAFHSALYTQEMLREIAARPALAHLLTEGEHELFASLVRLSDSNMALVEQNVFASILIREETLASATLEDFVAFKTLLGANNPQAIQRLSNGRRAVMVAGSGDLELSRLTMRAIGSTTEAELATNLAAVRTRGGLTLNSEQLALLERRISTSRLVDRLDLTTHISNMTAAERRIFEAIHPDDWNLLFDYARPRVNAFNSGNARSRTGAVSSLKGVIAEEAFFQTRDFHEIMDRARQLAVSEGLNPAEVRFVRGSRGVTVSQVAETGAQELTDGLIIVRDGNDIRVLAVIESKSPSNILDMVRGSENYFGQIVNDYERFRELPAHIDNVWYRSGQIKISRQNTEWIAVIPDAQSLRASNLQRFTDSLPTMVSGFNLRVYNNLLRDDILNRVAERMLQIL